MKKLYDILYWDRYGNTCKTIVKAKSQYDAERIFYKTHWRDLIRYTTEHKAD